jgi:putative ABC transport system permease protein
MSLIDGLRHRARVWFSRRDYERGIDDELRFHLDLDAEQRRDAHGDDAPLAARRRFGNVTYLKEETRHAARLDRFDGATHDVRHLIRSLRRSPGFAAVAVLTLALGIGATTAVLSVVDHVLVHSLPFRDAGRLMMMLERGDRGGSRPPSAPTVEDWRRDPGVQRAFAGVSFVRGDGATFRDGDEARRVLIGFVGPEFFSVLGVRPLLGRLLSDDDHRAGAEPAVVVSHAFWQQRLGGDRSVIGRRISLDSVPTTIVGVMPVGATYPAFASIWEPLSQYRHQEIMTRRGLHADSRTIARLRPGVDSARAVALMSAVGGQLAAAYPVEQAHWSAAMYPVRDELIGDVRPMLLTLAGAAAAVLLLACANVANLFLARVASRTRELAVRGALGASRARLVRQLLTESLVFAVAGGALGTMLAAIAVRLARNLPSDRLPRVEELSVDHRVLAVAAAASLLTAVMCGVWPAWRATRSSSGDALRAGALGSVGVRSESRVRRALVTVQFALALMLLVGAGLLLQSFRRAAAVEVGFDPRGLVTVTINPPAATYQRPEDAAALYGRLITAVRAVPGVIDAAFINHVPFGLAAILSPIEIEGRAGNDTGSNQIFYRTASETYLRTMKMTLAGGRWFSEADMRSPGGSFVINAAAAKFYWPGENAIGKRLTLRRSSQVRADFGQPLAGTVIGVVNDVHQTSQEAVPDREVYVPYALETWPWGSVVVRTRDGARSLPALRDAIAGVDARLIEKGAAGTERFSTVESVIASRLAPRKLALALIGAFAVSALLLAAIGLYGVVAYGITQRTRELGVRKALGATDRMIASLVFRESVILTSVGIVVGCAGAWEGARLIHDLLFQTDPADMTIYAPTVLVLVGIALVATYIPTRRATRLDPTIAMRGE